MTPFSEEESSYAACWVQGVSQVLLKKAPGPDQEKEASEGRTGQWEPLDNLLLPIILILHQQQQQPLQEGRQGLQLTLSLEKECTLGSGNN